MSGSSRPPASRRRRRRAPWSALALACALLPLCSAGARGESGPAVKLRLAVGATPDRAVERFLREDLAWVARPSAATPPAAAGAAPPTRALAARLRDRWLARGYLAADCAADSGAAGAGPGATLVVAPGPRFRVGEVTVGGPDFPGRARVLAAALPARGAWFDPEAWEEAVARLLAAAGEAGHPFARWVIGEVRVDAARAAVDLTATLFTGPRVWLGPITSDLPGGRGAAFLRRASGLTPGAPYRESDLARARERLEARGLWQEVGEPLVHTANAADTVGVFWPIVPVPRPNRFTAVIGLSRRDAGDTGGATATGGSRLSGQVDLLLPNLAGTGRKLALAWTDDGRGRSRLGFSYLEPLAFGTPLDLEGSLANEVEQASYTRFTADLRARLAVKGAWGLEFGLGRDRGTYPEGIWSATRRLRARAAVLRQRGDPGRSGWGGQFGLETARRQAVARVDTAAGAPVSPAGGTDVRQSLLDLAWNGEAFLTSTLSLAARGAFAEVRGDGGPFPLTEQYRFGGARTLRGYREGAFHGDRVAYGSLELRIGRPYRSRLYTFFDLGYFRFAAAEATVEDPGRIVSHSGTPRGFGLGLETRTAGGDVSLAIGLPGRWNFDAALLHVALLQAF
ncbi:MAG: BamA/TamA family outer membrane protein [Candidatus Krumholzibacteriia bacterium]